MKQTTNWGQAATTRALAVNARRARVSSLSFYWTRERSTICTLPIISYRRRATCGRRRVRARARARHPRAALVRALHARRPRHGCLPSAVALLALSGALSLSLSLAPHAAPRLPRPRPEQHRGRPRSSKCAALALNARPHRAPSPSPSSPSPPPSRSRSPSLSTPPPRLPCSRARVGQLHPLLQSHFHANSIS